MGYYTYFNLKIDKDREKIETKLSKVLDSEKDAKDLIEWGIELKWYCHEEDLKEISKGFPNTLIVLEGKGEAFDDFWIKYFLGGKMQVCTGEIHYDEFDENKLK